MKLADIISQRLMYYMQGSPADILIPNFFVGMYEMDLFKLSKTGNITEFEIKISLSDFKADFKKGGGIKHANIRSGQCKCNRFYYVIPKGIVPVELIPKYAGLYEFEKDHFNLIKNAPMLHKNKFSDYKGLAISLGYRERIHRQKLISFKANCKYYEKMTNYLKEH